MKVSQMRSLHSYSFISNITQRQEQGTYWYKFDNIQKRLWLEIACLLCHWNFGIRKRIWGRVRYNCHGSTSHQSDPEGRCREGIPERQGRTAWNAQVRWKGIAGVWMLSGKGEPRKNRSSFLPLHLSGQHIIASPGGSLKREICHSQTLTRICIYYACKCCEITQNFLYTNTHFIWGDSPFIDYSDAHERRQHFYTKNIKTVPGGGGCAHQEKRRKHHKLNYGNGSAGVVWMKLAWRRLKDPRDIGQIKKNATCIHTEINQIKSFVWGVQGVHNDFQLVGNIQLVGCSLSCH